jgi:hypothetical protein
MTTDTSAPTADDPNGAPRTADAPGPTPPAAAAVTFVATLKPAAAGVGGAQRAAVRSWRDARPACHVVLVGDEPGTAELASELGVEHVPDVARNDLGTPLLDDVLRIAAERARADLVCLLNGDVVVSSGFVDAALELAIWRPRFLMVGQCADVDGAPAATTDAALRAAAATGGLRGPEALDFFVFPAGLFGRVPPFALGRTGFDNWLVWRAQELGAPVVDVTRAVPVLHVRHDYGHLPGGKDDAYHGVESRRNWELAGGPHRFRTLEDADFRLTPAGPRRNLGAIGRVASRRRRLAWKLSRAIEHARRLVGT